MWRCSVSFLRIEKTCGVLWIGRLIVQYKSDTLLMPWRRVLNQKPVFPLLFKKLLSFYENRSYITLTFKSSAWTRWTQSTPSNLNPKLSFLFNINLNIILISKPNSSKWSFSFTFLHHTLYESKLGISRIYLYNFPKHPNTFSSQIANDTHLTLLDCNNVGTNLRKSKIVLRVNFPWQFSWKVCIFMWGPWSVSSAKYSARNRPLSSDTAWHPRWSHQCNVHCLTTRRDSLPCFVFLVHLTFVSRYQEIFEIISTSV